jgi:hypothetical protein
MERVDATRRLLLLTCVALLATHASGLMTTNQPYGVPGAFECPTSSQSPHALCYCTNGCSINGDTVFPWSAPAFPPVSVDQGSDTICAALMLPCTTDAAMSPLLAFLGVTGNVHMYTNATCVELGPLRLSATRIHLTQTYAHRLAARNSFAGCAANMTVLTATSLTQAECAAFQTMYNNLTVSNDTATQMVPYAYTCTDDNCNTLGSVLNASAYDAILAMTMGMPSPAPASPSPCDISSTVGKLSIAGVVLGAFASLAAVLILLSTLIANSRGTPKEKPQAGARPGLRRSSSMVDRPPMNRPSMGGAAQMGGAYGYDSYGMPGGPMGGPMGMPPLRRPPSMGRMHGDMGPPIDDYGNPMNSMEHVAPYSDPHADPNVLGPGPSGRVVPRSGPTRLPPMLPGPQGQGLARQNSLGHNIDDGYGPNPAGMGPPGTGSRQNPMYDGRGY